MLKLRGSLVLSLAAAAALIPSAPAPGASSAQRFADAVERGKAAIRAKELEFRAAFEAVDAERCARVVKKKPPPEREVEHFFLFLTAGFAHPLYATSKPVLDQIVADLSAIPTRDPILRSGRAAWREVVAYLGRLPQVDKPCEQIEAWANSGWKASARPAFDFKARDRLIEETDAELLERKFKRAVQRMRELGVSKGDAERFKGETLFDDVPDGPLESILDPGAADDT
jgi:hypothetical protein